MAEALPRTRRPRRARAGVRPLTRLSLAVVLAAGLLVGGGLAVTSLAAGEPDHDAPRLTPPLIDPGALPRPPLLPSTRPAPDPPAPGTHAAPQSGQGATAPRSTAEWEAELARREEALARAQEALNAQMKALRALEEEVATRWREADALVKAAGQRWEADAARLVTPDGQVMALPVTGTVAEAQLEQVVGIVRRMRAKESAPIVAGWDDALAVDVLGRLPPRIASGVLAALPAQQAARLTTKMARAGLPTPLRPGETP